MPDLKPCYGKCERCVWKYNGGCSEWNRRAKKRSGMACRAKESGKISRRGKPSIEWHKDGKPQYYCYGYIEKMTDELLTECKECRSHVDKAQDALDEYNHRKENDYGKV